MPFTAIEAYLERLPARMAEFKLAIADAVSIPHMPAEDRDAAIDSWRHTANMDAKVPAQVVPVGVLRARGINVIKRSDER